MSSAAVRARGLGGEIHYMYGAALTGFAASLPEQALKGLVHNPNVEQLHL
jgi:aqualysin 1